HLWLFYRTTLVRGRHPERVGLLERLGVFGRDGELGRLGRRAQLVEIGGADDRRGHVGLAQHPGERGLGGRAVLAQRDLLQPVDNLPVAVAIGAGGDDSVVLGPLGRAAALLAAIAGEEAARQRRIRDQADALLLAELVHLAFFLALDEIVEILH